MSSNAGFDLKINLITCPFYQTCSLPKIQFLCKNPDCKNCPDYSLKLEHIKY